jgi:hypothetical protein
MPEGNGGFATLPYVDRSGDGACRSDRHTPMHESRVPKTARRYHADTDGSYGASAEGRLFPTFTAGGALAPIFDPATNRVHPANSSRTIRTAFPGNVIPQNRIDPVGIKMMEQFPLPNRPATNWHPARSGFARRELLACMESHSGRSRQGGSSSMTASIAAINGPAGFVRRK